MIYVSNTGLTPTPADAAAPVPEQKPPRMGRLAALGCFAVALVAASYGVYVLQHDWEGAPGDPRWAPVRGALAGLAFLGPLIAVGRGRGIAGAVGQGVCAAIIAAGVVGDYDHQAGGGRYSQEAEAIGVLRTLTTAQALFREGDKDADTLLNYAASMEALGRAHLLSGAPARGRTRGYRLRILAADEFTWSAQAEPLDRCCGPERHFFVDESGVIRFSTTRQPATSLDLAIGG